jgi:hypothetical protein
MDAILTIVGGLLVALATAFFTSRFYVHQATTDLRNEYQRRFNEKKWNAYTAFASTVKDVLVSTKAGRGQRDQSKQAGQLMDFMSELWLVGSDDVIYAVLAWRQSTDRDPTGKLSLEKLAEMLIAMRKDLGDTSTKIVPRDLLGTFINDIDSAFPTER